MFYYLCGELALAEPNTAVVDCGGVGYRLTISGVTLGALSGKTGEKVKLFTYLAVREDGIELFGFYTQAELSAFRMLISVSGVGPKAAMSVLSLLNAEKFALAVTASDTKTLSKAPGIGAKTAARIVLELKDKISKEIKTEGDSPDFAVSGEDTKLADAQNTLMVLGYTRSESMNALRAVDTDALPLEDIIKESLKRLMKN